MATDPVGGTTGDPGEDCNCAVIDKLADLTDGLPALANTNVTIDPSAIPVPTINTVTIDDADLTLPGGTPAPLTVDELTTETVAGTGVFDRLMRAGAAHLEHEFLKGRIKGPEYSEVYLGTMQNVLSTSVDFLTRSRLESLQALKLQQDVVLGKVEVFKARAQLEVLKVEIYKARMEAEKTKAELVIALQQQELIRAQTLVAYQQALNEAQQRRVLVATECKLRAEFDLVRSNTLRTDAETELVTQKRATELAQTQGTGVTLDSVIGRQKALYQAQADGFKRDAEQKAAKIMIDTWSVRRTTDETGTQPSTDNRLRDTDIGIAVSKLLAGLN